MKTYNLQPTTYNKRTIAGIFFVVVSCLLLVVSWAHAQSTYDGVNVPYIHPRSEWLNTPELQNLFFWYPYTKEPNGQIQDYYPVSRIVIHDSGCNVNRPGCNDETIDPITQIQNTYRFHALTRGWGDIGYHYIIDHKGEIWEGRYGGNGVRGAHVYNDGTCQNFNVGTIGIELMGNYYDTAAPAVMMQSLEKLVAWLAYANNIDIKATTTTSVWTNPKTPDNKCQADIGGFTTSFTGPTVLTHRQLEANNSDIKSMDFDSLWNGAFAYENDIKTYAFSQQGSNDIFDFVQAKLQTLTNNSKKVLTVIKSQLDWFRPELFAKVWEPTTQVANTTPAPPQFPDGSLLKAKGKEEVYLIKDQQRTHISSAALFEGLGLKWSDIKEIDDTTLTTLVMGQPIVFSDGILLQAGTPDVYYIKDSKRYLISSADLFIASNFNWNDIIRLTLPELDRYYPWGGYVKWPEGSVLKNNFNPAQVVVVQNNALQQLAGSLPKNKPVHLVNGREIASYQSAQVLTPSVALAFSQAFDLIKRKLGLGTSIALATNSKNIVGSDTMTPTTATLIPTTIPAPPPPPATPATLQAKQSSSTSSIISVSATLIPEPTIKIGLCKTRNIAGDLSKCAFSSGDVLTITTDDQGITTVDGYFDPPGFNTNLNDNRFRGKVYTTTTADGKIWLINELPLESYLKGIGETSSTDKPEYRKMLITIARTYAYYYLTQEKKYPGMPFDLNNLSYSQVYRGYNYELRSNGLPAVVDDSHGQIVIFNGKPIVGAYSSDSGGVTKNACPNVFPKYCDASGTIKSDYAYLKGGIVDPPGTPHSASKIAASHGTGVSAIGARTMVDMGKTSSEVIKYYYPGVDLQKIY